MGAFIKQVKFIFMMTLTRQEQKEIDTWDLSPIFKTEAQWKELLQECQAQKNGWHEVNQYKNTLGESPKKLLQLLDAYFLWDRKLSKLGCYAHLKNDQDLSDNDAKTMDLQASDLAHNFASYCSWIEPEILALPEDTLKDYCKNETLKPYRFFLKKLLRLQPHTLSQKEEALFALSQKAMQTPHQAFSMLNDSDFDFGNVEDSEREKHPLTHASYSLFLYSPDRTLRKNSYLQLLDKYQKHENTLASLLQGCCEKHCFNAKVRGYKDPLEASLFPKSITENVYLQLIDSVHQGLPVLQEYLRFRKKTLALDELKPYDLNTPLFEDKQKYSYEEAAELVADSVAPLGKDYQNTLRAGLLENRWVDRYENKSKRSGAYSSGCYDSPPYILMNFKGSLRDVFTLAHEAGHSMHSYYSKKTQSYHESRYQIFVAEVASTLNEELLFDHMIKRCSDKREKQALVAQRMEDIRNTLFRQTLFAEFEKQIHDACHQGQPLTPHFLNESFAKLNDKYYGAVVNFEPNSKVEWARIPHFYYNFYVYQYATGVSAALALVQAILANDSEARDHYLQFLSLGGSCFPLEQLQVAGVDMSSPEPIRLAIASFEKQLELIQDS